MGIEIERKFLVNDEGWRAGVRQRSLLRQGYIANTARASVRVRLAGDQGWLSVKSTRRGVRAPNTKYLCPPSRRGSCWTPCARAR